jgi:hypothetical protein
MSGLIEGRVQRKTANALEMTFQDGPRGPIAVALQSGADGKGAKVGILFGFKNGGVGTHLLTYADGRALHVKSGDAKPTLITQADGATVATIDRGEVSVARASGGTEIMAFRKPAFDGDTADARMLLLVGSDGDELGRLFVVLRTGGWALASDLVSDFVWWGQAGQPLKLPVLGTSVALTRPLTALELDVVLGACVDIAIGLRPYVKGM